MPAASPRSPDPLACPHCAGPVRPEVAGGLWHLSPIDWPVEDRVTLAELLSSHHLEADGDRAPLSPQEMRRLWDSLRSRHPEYLLGR